MKKVGHTIETLKSDLIFLASPDAQKVMWVTQSLTQSGLADLTNVTLVSDDTFRRLGTWVTHDHLSSVIDEDDDT